MIDVAVANSAARADRAADEEAFLMNTDERDELSRRDSPSPSSAGAGRGLDTPSDYDEWKQAARVDPDLPREIQRRAGDMHRGYADDPEGDMPQKPSDFQERDFTGDPGPKRNDTVRGSATPDGEG